MDLSKLEAVLENFALSPEQERYVAMRRLRKFVAEATSCAKIALRRADGFPSGRPAAPG